MLDRLVGVLRVGEGDEAVIVPEIREKRRQLVKIATWTEKKTGKLEIARIPLPIRVSLSVALGGEFLRSPDLETKRFSFQRPFQVIEIENRRALLGNVRSEKSYDPLTLCPGNVLRFLQSARRPRSEP